MNLDLQFFSSGASSSPRRVQNFPLSVGPCMSESVVARWCVPGARVVVYPRFPGRGVVAFVTRVAGVSERCVSVCAPHGSSLILFPRTPPMEVELAFDCGWAVMCLASEDSYEGRWALSAGKRSY